MGKIIEMKAEAKVDLSALFNGLKTQFENNKQQKDEEDKEK